MASAGWPELSGRGLVRTIGPRGPPNQWPMALMRTCASVDASAMDEVLQLQAEVLRTLAHPRRLAIVHQLAAGTREVGRLAAELGISQPNVSQHLAVLRA